jgi:hypothetical protein
MNIYEKLLNITSEIKNVSKNLEVGIGKNSYKAVGEADVLFAVKQLEQKFKVYSYPCKREVIDRAILETEKEYNGNVTKGNQIFLRIETTYRFVNIEKPEEYIEITTYGDGIDTQDKAVGKAMTYADKYALLKAYKIITGDDPDQEHSPDTAKYTKATATGDDRKATPKQIEVLAKTYTGENLAKLLKANGVERIEDISMSKASELIGRLKKKEN